MKNSLKIAKQTIDKQATQATHATIKNIARRASGNKPGCADKITIKKRAIGGAITEDIKANIKAFLNDNAETIYNLKIILLEKLCEAIIDKTRNTDCLKYDFLNHNFVYLEFKNNPGLYDYNLTKFEHYLILKDKTQMNIYYNQHKHIDYIVYTLKFVNNLYSLIKKDPVLNKNIYKFNTDHEFSFMDNTEPFRNRDPFNEKYTEYKSSHTPIIENQGLLLSLLNNDATIKQIKKDIIAFLKEQEETIYNLKIELLDKLSMVLIDATRDNKFFYLDSKKYYFIYINFNNNNSLYNYNLNHFIHDDDEVYEDINDIIFLLKFVNNIYSLVKEEKGLKFESKYDFKPEKRWQLSSDYRRPRDKDDFKNHYEINSKEQADAKKPDKQKIDFETTILKIMKVRIDANYLLKNLAHILNDNDITLVKDEDDEDDEDEEDDEIYKLIYKVIQKDNINQYLTIIKNACNINDSLSQKDVNTSLKNAEDALQNIILEIDKIKEQNVVQRILKYEILINNIKIIVGFINNNINKLEQFKTHGNNYYFLAETPK